MVLNFNIMFSINLIYSPKIFNSINSINKTPSNSLNSIKNKERNSIDNK